MSKMKFSKELDGATIGQLGLLDFNVDDLHPFELYGIRNSDRWHGLLVDYWHYSLHLSVVYVLLIYVGRWWMRDRPAMDLRLPMTLWSGFLAVASIMGTWRSANVLLATVRDHGLMVSVCHPHFYYNSNAVWGAIFIISKPLELGDTAFIVLRKQPLIFLHWYHHVTVMVYVLLSFHEHSAPGHYFYVVNYGVHALMYSYYALKALRVRLPPWLPVAVTSVQLSQMVLGTAVLSYVLLLRAQGSPCQISDRLLLLGLLMYLSYFLLFGHFFYRAYFKGHYWRERGPSKAGLANGTASNGHHANGAIANGKKHA